MGTQVLVGAGLSVSAPALFARRFFMQTISKLFRSLTNSPIFWFIVFVLGVGVYTFVTTPNNTLKESPQYFACLKEARDEYINFWHTHQQASLKEIEQADASYDSRSGQCAEKYSIAWQHIKAAQEVRK